MLSPLEKATMTHRQSFEQCKEQVSRYRENGCCTVIALANTMDWSFGKAHRFMAKHGREHGARHGDVPNLSGYAEVRQGTRRRL